LEQLKGSAKPPARRIPQSYVTVTIIQDRGLK
jgi:hypothetical protein